MLAGGAAPANVMWTNYKCVDWKSQKWLPQQSGIRKNNSRCPVLSENVVRKTVRCGQIPRLLATVDKSQSHTWALRSTAHTGVTLAPSCRPPAVLLTWLSASQTDTETDTVLTILRSPIKRYLSTVLLATLLTWLSASQLTDRHGAHNTPLTYQALP